MEYQMSGGVKVDVSEGVGVVVLNRPDQLNAWDSAIRQRLVANLAKLDADDSVRAIVLTGAGDRAFCSGQDLNETERFALDDAAHAEKWIDEFELLYDAIRKLRKPVVAALNGIAAGSGFQFALLCDILVGHPGVRMGQPEINTGIPSITGLWVMRDRIGQSRTVELALTGRLMEAEEASRIGLIHYLVPEDKVYSQAMEVASQLGAKPPLAFALTKQRLCQLTESEFRESFRAARRIHREAYASGEPQELMRQFFASRAARGN